MDSDDENNVAQKILKRIEKSLTDKVPLNLRRLIAKGVNKLSKDVVIFTKELAWFFRMGNSKRRKKIVWQQYVKFCLEHVVFTEKCEVDVGVSLTNILRNATDEMKEVDSEFLDGIAWFLTNFGCSIRSARRAEDIINMPL